MNGPDAPPPKEPLCQTCGQAWDADEAAERCTYPECPYGDTTVWGGERAPPKGVVRSSHGTHTIIRQGSQPPPSDVAPVAWRWRWPKHFDSRLHGWSHGPEQPNFGDHEKKKGMEIQPLYAHPEDAPGGPWEGLARMMYDSLTCQHRACFFCGRTVGHEKDCQWGVLNRLKGDET